MSTEMLNKDSTLQLFEICLHREEYFPGEIVTGKLFLVTCSTVKTEGVYIKFEGKGAVRWKKRAAHLCGLQEAVYVHEKRKYFSNIYRYDFDSLPEGCTVLTFEFELPTGIPQSIEAGTIMKQLKIAYSVEALALTSAGEYRQQKPFTVKSILNMNAYPELSLPICKTIMDAIFESCWSSSGRVITISFSIKKQGFVPGERVESEVAIKGGRNLEFPNTGIEVNLIQEIDLTIETASRVRRRIVAKGHIVHVSNNYSDKSTKYLSNSSGKCRTKLQRKWKFVLTIPENILISYENTDKQVHDFISIRYFLRMSLEQTSFPYKPLQIQLPVKVGTVFLKERKHESPIQLLAPVPFVLPRPRAPIEAGCKRISTNNVPITKQPEKQHLDTVADPYPHTNNNNPLPKIYVNARNSSAISEEVPISSTGISLSPRTPKRKLGTCTNTVQDLSGSLHKPMEAFGGDSDSESFRG